MDIALEHIESTKGPYTLPSERNGGMTESKLFMKFIWYVSFFMICFFLYVQTIYYVVQYMYLLYTERGNIYLSVSVKETHIFECRYNTVQYRKILHK